MAARDPLHQPKSLPSTQAPEQDRKSREGSLLPFYVRALGEVFGGGGRYAQAGTFLVAALTHAFGNAVLALAAGRCAVALAGMVGNGLGNGDGNSAAVGSSVAPQALRTAIWLGSIGLCAAVLKAAGGVVAAHGQARIAGRVASKLRLEVLDRWFMSYRLRRPRHDDHGPQVASSADLSIDGLPGLPPRAAARGVSALTARVREVEVGLSAGLLGGGRALAQLVPLLAVLVWIAPKLALAAFVVLAPFAALLGRSRRVWKQAHQAASADNERLLEAADEAVRHADLWVAYSAESKARAAVSRLGETLARGSARLEAGAAAMSGGNEVLGALGLVCALAAAGAGWLGDVGGNVELLGFTVCFFLAYRPIRDLAEARLAWSRAATAFCDLAGELSEVSGDPEASTTPSSARTSAPSSGGATGRAHGWRLEDLHVEGVELSHGTHGALSFTVPAGALVVLVGPTGEGKTTLLRTLLGLEPCGRGQIRYGTTSLNAAPPGLLHRPFAWVPQDAILLADTLEANVTLGGPGDVEAGMAALGASRLARATQGLRVGAGGVAVSGGEKQWIALARALATRQPVLLLDEPTSGLDAAAQSTVIDAIARLKGRRSVLLVTHRHELLSHADAVIRLEAGGSPMVSFEEAPPRSRVRAPA